MNKKFSTFLCASLLLASAFTTANAADLTGVNNGADAFMVSKLGIWMTVTSHPQILAIS